MDLRSFRCWLLIIFVFPFSAGWAQTTIITGKITEKATGDPIPYANIVIPGTFIGTMSDLNGNYHLTAVQTAGKVEITSVGFKKQIISIKDRQINKIDAALEEETFALNEVEVKPGENPANKLISKVITARKDNNYADFPSWKCKLYSKTEVDIKNLNQSLATIKFLSQFKFVLNYIDSLKQEGKTFLPVLFNETVSNYYHDKVTNKDREEIIANKASGMTTDMITQFTGKMYEGVNIYDNYIMLTDIGLVSPVNALGLEYYRYYLLDSTMIDGCKVFELSFRPRLPQEPVFTGKIWVADSTYALTKVDIKLSDKANVNFINSFQYSSTFQKKGEKWIPAKEVMVVDLDVLKDKKSEKMGLIGRKTNIYEDFQFTDVSAIVGKMKERIAVTDEVMKKDDNYWHKNRPEELQLRESNIYQMVDSIKNVPLYKTISDYVYLFYYGYYDMNKVELGPYYYMYSSNIPEGTRFRLGIRTTYALDQHLRLNGFGAYGTKDRKWKYGGGFEYYFNMKPLDMVSFQAQHDMEMLGKSTNAFAEGNIMTTILGKGLNSKLSLIDRMEFTARYEWRVGLMNELTVASLRLHSSDYVPFMRSDGKIVPSLQSGEIRLGLHFAPNEDVVIDDFDRDIYQNYNPVLDVNLTKGFKGLLGGDFNYTRLNVSLYDKMLLYPIGYSTFLIQAGKIWGDVPWPFLKIHEGNETYAFDTNAFNLMNYQEFVSDEYVSLFYEHHFQGFFLNKIPVFRKLKWREIAGVRLLKGNFSEEKHNSLVLPGEMKGLKSMPYTEFSAGIENILKILRVDAVWRFNYNDNVKNRLGLLFSLQITL